MSSEEIDTLRAEINRLTARLDSIERATEDASSAGTVVADADGAAVSRRQWVRGAAAAAVGGTAAIVAGARPAAAAAGAPLNVGENHDTAVRTTVDYTGSDAGVGFLMQSGTVYQGDVAAYPAAVGGWTTVANQPTGVYGFTNVDTSADVEPNGVVGLAFGAGGNGVLGKSTRGAGVRAEGATYGVDASGDTAAMVLTPTDVRSPEELTDFHRGGELYARAASDSGLAVELWFCVVGGEPGIWKQISGPSIPGSFRALSPVRVYDSRAAAPDPGRLAGGESRVVDISLSRDLSTGASTGTAVPEGASAITFNLGVVGTAGRGFLSVAPSYATEFSAATINWSESGQVLNNGSLTLIGTDRKVKVFAGDSGSTQFVIDITGYWT